MALYCCRVVNEFVIQKIHVCVKKTVMFSRIEASGIEREKWINAPLTDGRHLEYSWKVERKEKLQYEQNLTLH